MTTIPIQPCRHCGVVNEGSTKIICDACFPTLTKSQILRFDHQFQLAVIALFMNLCVDCGHSAEAKSGELCADHLDTKGSDPLSRYDLANACCRCAACHAKRHTGEVKRVPPKAKLPKQTAERAEKRKRLAVCARLGCPIWAMGTGKKPLFCWKHQ